MDTEGNLDCGIFGEVNGMWNIMVLDERWWGAAVLKTRREEGE